MSGVTAMGVATVLTAFMSGLALGSYILGRVGHSLKQPLLVYGFLELAIGGYALLLPFLFNFMSGLFVVIVQAHEFSFFSQTLIRFLLAFSVLIIPTTLMGGTLPVLSAYFIRSRDQFCRSLGLLYSANTVGAVLGTLLAGFVLLERLGSLRTTIVAVCLNCCIFLASVYLAGRDKRSRIQEGMKADHASSDESGPPPLPIKPLEPYQRAVLMVALLSGFSALALEVIWTRLLVISIGSSTYAFTTILATFLFGIAFGSYLFSRWLDRLEELLLVLSGIQTGIGITALLIMPFFEFLPRTLSALKFFHHYQWFPVTLSTFLLTAAVMTVPTLLMGATFPLVSRLVAGGREKAGFSAEIGIVYSVNTIGSIAGSFAAGFLLIPLIGVKYGLFTAVAANFIAGILMVIFDSRRTWKSYAFIGIILVFIGINIRFTQTWDPLIYGGNLTGHLVPQVDEMSRETLLQRQLTPLFYEEGIQSTIMVVHDMVADVLALKVDGKTVASSQYFDVRVQKMLGHLPVLLCPTPRTALVIGLGTGMTFGALTIHADLQTRCIELEKSVVGAAATFRACNNDAVMKRSNADIVIDDGRNYILTHPKKVDIITMDPIHPWVAGAASLYSLEHFQKCLERLTENGIMCLWTPLYQLSERDYKIIIRTFLEVFPQTQLWYTNTDTILIGSPHPISLDLRRVKAFMQQPEVQADLDSIHLGSVERLLSCYWADREALINFTRNVPLNVDDLPLLEYSAPRTRFTSTVGANISRLTTIRQKFDIPLNNCPPELKVELDRLFSIEQMATQGRILYFNALDNKALTVFQKALDLEPEHGDYLYYAADIFNKLGKKAALAGDNTQALHYFQQAVRSNPLDLEAQFNLSVAYNRVGDFQKETELNAWLIKRQPRLAAAHLALADSLVWLGYLDAALDHYKIALQLQPALENTTLRAKIDDLSRVDHSASP